MKIFKFGGASVKDASGVKNLLKVISLITWLTKNKRGHNGICGSTRCHEHRHDFAEPLRHFNPFCFFLFKRRIHQHYRVGLTTPPKSRSQEYISPSPERFERQTWWFYSWMDIVLTDSRVIGSLDGPNAFYLPKQYFWCKDKQG